MKEFGINKEIIRKDRLTWNQMAFIGGHTDDDAMFRLTNKLAEQQIGVTILTLTNSDARNLPNYEPEQLAKVRWEEAVASGKVAGITQVRRIEIPDGKLFRYQRQAVSFVRDALMEVQPIGLVTLHHSDPHADHRATHNVGAEIAGNELAHYMTDTITGYDRFGTPLQPDVYVPLTEEIEMIEQETYLANSSQIDVPLEDRKDVANVLAMTARRGKEINSRYASVIFRANKTKDAPIEDILL